MIYSFLLVVLASFFLGTFGLGMKYNKPMSWEAFWGLHAVTAMLLVPAIWALLVIPDPLQSIANAPTAAIVSGILLGFFWGIGGVMFGLSVKYVGVSLTYGIVMGTTGTIGALVPLAQMDHFYQQSNFPVILAGIFTMVVSVFVVTRAGLKREKNLSEKNHQIEGIKKGDEFRKGLFIVYVGAILSSLLNIGFANAYPVAESAIAKGATEMNASILVWVVVLWGAIFFNIIYSVTLLVRNKSWGSVTFSGSSRAWFWAIASGIMWFFSMAFYGLGAARMGDLGTVVGWPVFVGLSLIFSNIWAIRSGEWKGYTHLKKLLFLGIAIMIAASVILAVANTL